MMSRKILFSMVAFVSFTFLGAVRASELLVGAGEADITPDRPVALSGMFRTRISTAVVSPVTVNVIALESREDGKPVDQAVLVSCDLVAIRPGILDGFREYMKGRLPDLDLDKIILAATHTHQAPVMLQERFQSYGDAMQPKEYVPFLYERMGEAVEKAWKSRAPGSVAWGLGHAEVAVSRRPVFKDGSVGGGKMSDPDFSHLEAASDHSVGVLSFFDAKTNLKAIAISVPCPAQAFQSSRCSLISADFWHDVRELLKKSYGKDLCVAGFAAPCGDQGPGALRSGSEERMAKLRGLPEGGDFPWLQHLQGWERTDMLGKLARAQEIGRRVANAVEDVLPVMAKDIRTDPAFLHTVHRFDLRSLEVKEEDFARITAALEQLAKKDKLSDAEYTRKDSYERVIERYEAQQQGKPQVCPVEMHTLRIGDMAIGTTPFELFTDYGTRIHLASPAGQTFLMQLANATKDFPDYGVYLPTRRAVEARGYDGSVESNLIGPEGGDILVERTVAAFNELWMAPGVLDAFRKQSEEKFMLADKADPAGWFQVDIKPFCNVNLYSTNGVVAPVQFYAIGTGRSDFYGVPTDIIAPADNDNRTAIALTSKRFQLPGAKDVKQPAPSETAPAKDADAIIGKAGTDVTVGRKADALFFLYATYYTLPEGEQYFRVNYDDGTSQTIPFVGTKQSGDWFHVDKRVYSEDVRHVLIPQKDPWHNRSFYCMHMMQWKNPNPGKEIKSVTLKSDEQADMAIFIAAVTGYAGKQTK